MTPSREVYWNIEYAQIVYILAAVAVGFMVYAFYRRYRLWRLGRPENRLDHIGSRVKEFLDAFVFDGLLHRKFLEIAPGLGHRKSAPGDFRAKELYPGMAHLFLFAGALMLLLATFLDFISHYFFDFLRGGFYLGFSAVVDSFGILLIVGAVMTIVRRYKQKPKRLDNKPEDAIALTLIIVVSVTGYIVEGLRIAATELQTAPSWAPWSPGGYVLARAFSGLSQESLLASHRAIWWLHMVLSIGAISYVALYWNRLWHILVSPMNVFLKSMSPKGALATVAFEQAERFGAGRVQDFTWKQLLDGDACTRCGRCQDACPAYASGKPLNPKKVIQDIKWQLENEGPYLLKGKTPNPVRDMVTQGVGEEEIWNCTTCRACQEACPVAIEHVQKLVDMRRDLVMERAVFPETAESALRSIEDIGHPWRGSALSRESWAEALGIKPLSDKSDVEYLYWVGCTSALEDRSVKMAQAVGKVLQRAGISFGILGAEESCCGDPARRLGNDYLFQKQARRNIEVMKRYGVKKIITSCPHGYNAIKNEYPQFGGDFEVIHYTEIFARLIAEKKLEVPKGSMLTVTYHDPCYLGRYNDIYQQPRQILAEIPNLTLVEMERNRERGFCCGGGGGHIWLEETSGRRICQLRVEEALETKAQVIVTACPWCLQMLELGLAGKPEEGTVRVVDLAELIVERF
ncbi:MAG: (Fe-S)-binding protein [Chloroflexi bacterium]|nr:(Fe-S)-binding protein [Chloroflexota bacterium]